MRQKPLILILIFWLTACAPAAQATLIPSETASIKGELTPYTTPSPSMTPVFVSPTTAPPLPSATPTPVTYTVKQGDELLSIAIQYGITLESLRAANPTVDPYMLSVGTVLVIPAGSSAEETPASNPHPTPMPVTLQDVHCYPQNDGGAWCFLTAYNGSGSAVESVTVKVSITGESGIVSRLALTPLNLLPVDASMPLMVYFPPPLAQPLQVGAELSSALPVPGDDARYLRAHIENLVVEATSDGLSAEIRGEVVLDSASDSASLIWVGGAAYDDQNNVIGVRRWESPSSLDAGGRLDFIFRVYSVAGKIGNVLAFVEARR